MPLAAALPVTPPSAVAVPHPPTLPLTLALTQALGCQEAVAPAGVPEPVLQVVGESWAVALAVEEGLPPPGPPLLPVAGGLAVGVPDTVPVLLLLALPGALGEAVAVRLPVPLGVLLPPLPLALPAAEALPAALPVPAELPVAAAAREGEEEAEGPPPVPLAERVALSVPLLQCVGVGVSAGLLEALRLPARVPVTVAQEVPLALGQGRVLAE